MPASKPLAAASSQSHGKQAITAGNEAAKVASHSSTVEISGLKTTYLSMSASLFREISTSTPGTCSCLHPIWAGTENFPSANGSDVTRAPMQTSRQPMATRGMNLQIRRFPGWFAQLQGNTRAHVPRKVGIVSCVTLPKIKLINAKETKDAKEKLEKLKCGEKVHCILIRIFGSYPAISWLTLGFPSRPSSFAVNTYQG